ncbi:MAG: RnfH family protein [Gammaproteobacteria bacterium]|nr:RnfH family protein [Gammaproteobacteria bacterium]
MADETFVVEVAYAKPEEQVILEVQASDGMTLMDTIAASGITERFPEIDLENTRFGIFGKAAKKDARLKAGDRVEIYRPLIADPKEARKKRAAEGKQLKKGGGKAV